jgi:hypothetical protein
VAGEGWGVFGPEAEVELISTAECGLVFVLRSVRAGVGGTALGGARSAFGQAFGGFVAVAGVGLVNLAVQRLKDYPKTCTAMPL